VKVSTIGAFDRWRAIFSNDLRKGEKLLPYRDVRPIQRSERAEIESFKMARSEPDFESNARKSGLFRKTANQILWLEKSL
jgi:hypothetical protein